MVREPRTMAPGGCPWPTTTPTQPPTDSTNSKRLERKHNKEDSLLTRKATTMHVPHSLLGVVVITLVLVAVAWVPQVSAGVIKYPPLMVKQPPSSEELLFQVAYRVDENDKPFIIECEAEGEPAPKYRWIKNGKEFAWQTYDDRISQQPGRGTLVITKPRDEDIGQYQCFATNELGTATSNSVFVRKSVLNSFSMEDPITKTVKEGDPAGLPCQAPDGYPRPLVYWMIQDDRGSLRSINSSRMTVDSEGTLWFSNVTRHDQSNDFTYACAATSNFRSEYKLGNKVYLRVEQTGSIAVQTKHEPILQFFTRTNTIVLKGQKLKIWCIFSGTPLPEIQWRKKGGVLPFDRVEYENYGKTLVIRYADFQDSGQYECEASNGVGMAKTRSMRVEVKAIPYFTVEPEIQNKAEGETAEFYCNATGVNRPTQHWIYNGMMIKKAPPNPRRIVNDHSIIIHDLVKSDTGNYGCNASNIHGYVYKDVYVNVLALPPGLRVPPSDLRVVDGAEVNMTCRMFGAPKPRITWIRDGMELTGGRYKITDEGDLYISEVAFSDSGHYTCFAENKFGTEEASGSLVVKDRTKITEIPQDYEVRAGDAATFRCNAVADPGLSLSIDWLTDGKKIDFETEPRFIQQSDFSLSISKTTELDSGSYTCVASTELDEIRKTATLIVQDVPNAPRLLDIVCNDKDASVEWQPQGDNRAHILGYIIQYNTSFTPDTWENAFDNVPSANNKFTVNLSPYANYTFRVIATNKIGPSRPSKHSDVCTTPIAVPNKNPEGVEGKGSNKDNLVIKWSPMPEIEHNGPGFKYRVYWKRDDVPGATWNTAEVVDWEQDHYVVDHQPTFKPYLIKVEAHNEMGQANVAIPTVRGWSGEDVPSEAPKNLRIDGEPRDATTARLFWDPVSNTSINGHFKGYKIQTWTEDETESKARDVIVGNNGEPSALVQSFVPYTRNYARVLVFNGAHDGPSSNTIDFVTPEGAPGPVDSLEAIPMGSSGFFLIWKKPKKPNGVLTGYHIYYQTVEGTDLGPESERDPPIRDPLVTRAKLAALRPGTKYRISIRARTQVGVGSVYYIERSTRVTGESPPGRPSMLWEHVSTSTGAPAIKVTWIPNTDTNPGSHFFVQYRLYGESLFQKTKPEKYRDFIVLEGLQSSRTYEVRLVAVDGTYETPSQIEEIETYVTGVSQGVVRRPADNITTRGWFIGMMLAIALLLLILVIVCIIKRNRGGKYAVHEREAQHGRDDFPEETGFPEYSQPLEGGKRDSLGSDVKPPVESDTESMAEYGDGEVAAGMNEDGSFIGKYGRQKTETSSNTAFATLV
uniref:Neuroglian-like n=1 Tax=Hirondellea gigas TaxID=1518452 RepID=A0A2P2I497_9CRUS